MAKKLIITPETTLGPFYPETFVPPDSNDLSLVRFGQPSAQGEVVRIEGTLFDENNVGRPRMLIEYWQANAAGAYRHPTEPRKEALDPNFDGWGRSLSDDEGNYQLVTILPGAAPGRMPHINVTLFGTGIDRLQTAIFFPNNAKQDSDPVLKAVGGRHKRLICIEEDAVGGVRRFRFDIRLRGENETPFFLD